MKAAALRLGSQGVPSSYDDHLLIIGDAAGHIDPLTGEGIHTALMVRPAGSPIQCPIAEVSCYPANLEAGGLCMTHSPSDVPSPSS